ncbi:MAG: SRPBCC family protein [Humibacillus sp.]|nr:SRPBCC family protein [Humibacillus sp.]MDN5779903.1 SRPBCC family protein [Humibacillus sp.]
MTSLTLRATGRAPTDLAWRRYADTRLWSSWSPQIRRVELDAHTHELRDGLTGRVVGPIGVSVRFEVESVDEAAMTWVWRVHTGPVTMRLHHAVLSEGDGCTTTLTIEGPALVAVSYSLPAQLALHRLVKVTP